MLAPDQLPLFDLPAQPLCQRWTERRHSWRHLSEGGFDRSRYDVAPIASDAVAKRFVTGHHYSGSYPSAIQRYGLYERGELVGVAVLSGGTNTKSLTNTFPSLAPFAESLELGRLVLVDAVPANAESWMLARVWELAAATGVRGVLSLSDPMPRTTRDGRVVMPGHVGAIYQAGNARYLGRATPRTLTLLDDGASVVVLDDRSIQKVRAGEKGHEGVERRLVALGARPRELREDGAAWLRDVLPALGARKQRHQGNHRYAFTIGRQRRQVPVLGRRQAYPKQPDALAA